MQTSNQLRKAFRVFFGPFLTLRLGFFRQWATPFLQVDMGATELPALARFNFFAQDTRTIIKQVSDVSTITVESLLEFIQETEK